MLNDTLMSPEWFLKLKTVVLNDYPKYRSGEARECGSGKREKWKARKVMKPLCSTTIQSVGVGSPRWSWCSAVRLGRGIGTLSQSESTTPENIMHNGVRNVQDGFGVVPSVLDGLSKMRLTGVPNGGKTEKHCAQRHSKVSESDGCPPGYAGRMGETAFAQ